MRFRFMHTVSCLLLLYLVASEAAVAMDKKQVSRQQGAGGLLSFLSGPNRTPAPKPGESSSSAATSLSSLTNGLQSIQNISFQNLIDATGITRLTDPIYNQARKRWQQLMNR
jgi:hypothetical protein